MSLAACQALADAPEEATIKEALEALPFKVRFRDVEYTGEGTVVAGVATKGGLVQPFAFKSGEDLKVKGDLFPDSAGRVQRATWQDGTTGPVVEVLMPPATRNHRVYTGRGQYSMNFALDEAVCLTWLTDDQCHSV